MTTTTEIYEDSSYDDEYVETCECELDWNCGLHANRTYTPIELIMDEWSKNNYPDEEPS